MKNLTVNCGDATAIKKKKEHRHEELEAIHGDTTTTAMKELNAKCGKAIAGKCREAVEREPWGCFDCCHVCSGTVALVLCQGEKGGARRASGS